MIVLPLASLPLATLLPLTSIIPLSNTPFFPAGARAIPTKLRLVRFFLHLEQDFILWKLDAIARLGYAAFALDLFGTGRALWDRAESLAARRPITEDRSLLQARANAAIRTLRQLDGVDPGRIAAVGYCFGGMAVLDLARASPAVPGLMAVASLHGILAPMLGGAGEGAGAEDTVVGPRVLVLHASGDPFVPPEQV